MKREQIGFNIGDLVKFKTTYAGKNVVYVRVDAFYDILPNCGGGQGFSYTMLDGTGNGSTPLSHISDFKKFKTIEDMQQDIDSGLQQNF